MTRPLFAVLAIAVVLLTAFAVSSWLTPNWEVESVADMEADRAAVHRFIADFDQWERWAQFREAEDPQVTLEQGEVEGKPVQRILVDGAERTQIRMDRVSDEEIQVSIGKPMAGIQTFRLVVLDENTTRVIWTDEGTVSTPLVGGLLAYDLSERLREHHATALRKLRALAESVDQEPVRSER
ncbi:MAG: SRPBCC family protein [Myxococcota bacterium]